MEATTGPSSRPTPPPQPNLEKIKQNLLRNGIQPTPRILHNLRKKELQKSNRRLAKRTCKQPPPLTDTQKLAISEESHFQTIKSEYKRFTKAIENIKVEDKKMVGRPWESLARLQLRELASENTEYGGEKLRPEHLRELSDIIEKDMDKFSWLLDNDIEFAEEVVENGHRWVTPKRQRGEAETIKFLVDRLSETELTVRDWKFSRMMRQSELQFTEGQMLKIVAGLGNRGQWRHALSVVEWVYSSKEHRRYKSRFVYTKLLAILGKARKPSEALQVFNLMRGDANIYPDMAAYHSLAVTLGQAGFLKELVNVIESMKERPKKIKNVRYKNWNPVLQPDVVVFNAVLNACVPTCQWKGVSWVFEQLRKNGLRPNGATYGLAMEVMLQSGKYDLVHEFYGKMKRSGEALKAVTCRVLVKAFWEEGKVDEAVRAVRDMEQRGVVGTASVYYELACCLCYYGRWQEAILEIEKLKKLRQTRSLVVTFTGMILSSMNGGHVHDCVSIFEHCKTHTSPDIGIINAMLKAYGQNDMFLSAKELFEETKKHDSGPEIGHNSSPKPDAYTFSSMLEASARALQWEYFEYVYKEMTLSGYQLFRSKHAMLLVEASRAGKWHLLEHAFDTILEAGEIPPLSFFTEMVFQATTQQDYKRAVKIINSMAHAPFRVSKQQWIELLEMNEARADLKELLDTLMSRDLVQEATVLNLSRALQVLCGSRDAGELLIASGFNSCGILPVNQDDAVSMECSDHTSNDTAGKDCDREMVSGSTEDSREGDGTARLTEHAENFDYDLESSTTVSHSDYRDNDVEWGYSDIEFDDMLDFDPDISSDKSDDSRDAGAPSAYAILETWKEMKRRDTSS
ncbi:Pentatricopeptide repeat-containing protein [Forsythia ovata]|uniref:Pentatricopeptide repeat-containing protein n=1 Tax=Forsythia ovata TaxID=205694 RepID=A0ABD1UBT5_9LAMI